MDELRRVRVRVPLAVEFQGARWRDATLIEGPAGWGEISPFPGWPGDADAAELSALEAATIGWPDPVRETVPVAAIIPAAPPEQAAELALAATKGWPDPVTVKLKMGGPSPLGSARGAPSGEDIDEQRVAAVRDALGPAARLRIDANGAWSVEQATRMLRKLGRYDIEFAEQPVATLDELAVLRRRVDVPVAADESVRGVPDARRLAEMGAADVLVVKVQAAGGVAAGLAMAEVSEVPVVVSSLVETSVGLAAGLALAACLPSLPLACGLGTGSLLAGDVVTDPLVPDQGRLVVRRPVPDPELLSRWDPDVA
jgi:O-succinylbenzoate synthase